MYFFFQAEDGIRDGHVTGVQTCALPILVSIYDIGRHENYNYIAMDYLAGGSIHDRMASGISAQEALRITGEVAKALDHAHQKGYIHRDKIGRASCREREVRKVGAED